jgi:hypothetical protein
MKLAVLNDFLVLIGCHALRNAPLAVFVIAVLFQSQAFGQAELYPHNAVACERCHNIPSKFGASPMTVERVGFAVAGKFLPSDEGGVRHRLGESDRNTTSDAELIGERAGGPPFALLAKGGDSGLLIVRSASQSFPGLAAC